MKHGLLFGLSAANVLLSAGLQFVPLLFFGAGRTVDMLVAALMVPSVVTSVSAVVVTYSLVPQLAGLEARSQGSLTRNAFVAVSALIGLPTAALIAFAPVWAPWTVPGFSEAETAATVELARISLAASLAGVYALVLSARMQANSEFVLSALASVLASSFATVFAVVAIGRVGIVAAAWSLVLRSVLQVAIAWALHPPRITGDIGTETVNWRLTGPLLASSAISKLEPLIDRSLLTTAPPGLLTLFYLAQQVYGALSQVVAGSLLAHVLTRFSAEARENDGPLIWRSLIREMWRASVVAFGVGVLLVGGYLAWELLIARVCPRCVSTLEAFDLKNLTTFMVAMGGVWFFGLQGIVLSSYFYAHCDAKTPSLVAIAGFGVAIGLKFIGFRLGGALGLAAANSLYLFSTAAAMFTIICLRHARVARA